MALVENQEVSSDAMLAGLSLIAEFRPPFSEAIVQRLLDVLEESSMPLKRSNATSILADSPLPEGTLEMLADRIDTLGPLEITNLLPAITKSGFNTLARAITSLERLDDLSGIRGDALENAVVSLPEELRDRGQALLERAAASTQQQRKRLMQIAASLPPGDRIRGYSVFSGNKSGCTTCHAMAYIGGRFGPDLSRIGQIRSSADLLESIVLPSLSFVRSYESVIVVTSSGKVFNGILRDQTNDAVTLQTGPSTTETLLRESIESIAPSQTSIMPKGYDVLLSPQELSDLIAFLQHAR
jgi:putative heme-binding domain-containing protein